MARRRSKARDQPHLVPGWVLVLLAAGVVGLVGVRKGLDGRVGRDPVPWRQGAPPVVEPPPFAETPPEERAGPPLRHFSESPAPAPGKASSPPAAALGKTAGSAPAVVLVLDDVGYRMDLVERACAVLPQEVTFAVLPHLPNSASSCDHIRERGFPVILHVPMEPEDGGRWKPGGGALYVGMPSSEVEAILSRDLLSVPHAEGVNNHMGSRATGDQALMDEVMAFLGRRGLYFLDSRTTTRTIAYEAARRAGIKSAQKYMFLDDEDSEAYILAHMDLLVSRAATLGPLVGIGHLRANTIEAFRKATAKWSPGQARLVPLREVVR